jgi:hypothetical protein
MEKMNRRLAVALLAGLVVAAPVYADFASVARALDAQQGMKRIWIPFLGVARALVRVAQPEGVHDFQLATFEGNGDVDPQALKQILQSRIGPGFVPLVQVWSKRSNDYSFIYARPTANMNRLELMILAHDGGDTVLVRVDVDAHVVAREIRDQPRRVSHHARR